MQLQQKSRPVPGKQSPQSDQQSNDGRVHIKHHTPSRSDDAAIPYDLHKEQQPPPVPDMNKRQPAFIPDQHSYDGRVRSFNQQGPGVAAQLDEGSNVAEAQPQSKNTGVTFKPSDTGAPVEVLRDTKYGPVIQTDTIRDEMCEFAILNLIHVICD